MKSFWQKLPKPFTVLAPMDGVTDVVFRQIITEFGKPDVLFTEFTMTDGLLSKGHEKVAERLLMTAEQTPVIAQIWGTNPEHFYQVAKELQPMGFAGIDINMGCPTRDVVKEGACSGLIRNPKLAAEIIQATREGAASHKRPHEVDSHRVGQVPLGRAGDLPVSVKTRIGFEKEMIDSWIGFLLEQDIPALTVHLRTVRELSKVPAHWDLMPQVLALRNKIAPDTVIIGNGDLASMEEINEKWKSYGNEGFMVGRGIFANPWMFDKTFDLEKITPQERVNYFLHHIELFEKQWHGEKHFALLKKFAKTYINNFPEAAVFREKLMESKNLEELKETLNNY